MGQDMINTTLTEGQQRLLNAMPELADCAFPQVRDAIPAANYIDPARFDAEMVTIFRREPVLACPSALLPEARAYTRVDLAGMPVLITRNKDGEAKAFANVCRHRGMKLCVSNDPVKAGRIVCPYHAWTYDMDGALIGLPRAETFPGLDKKDLGLFPLPCVEAGGLIWVGLDADNPPDFAQVRGELEADFDALGLGRMQVYDRTTFKVGANWKLVMDSMLDSYHVTRLHKDSLARFFVDSENVIDRIGPHIRNAAHRGNFEKTKISTDFEEMRQMMVFSYIPFPNGIIVASPEFISLGIVRPIATDQCEVDYYMLINQPPADEKTENRMRRSFELMGRAFGQEDYWAAEMCDKGLRSGTMKEVHLGGMEIQIRMFQDAVTDRLKKAGQA
ncbi:aromatic ring-hydroxylating oxygenase subunit alpha [Sphingopyxis yananensis]|uniref:aromatic ring-hydroxylating oxygenase subunit alpha n=1 Tax=Sphingopyxis yananensis TaxID=2886687 RepID=UPI001D12B626|nr:aromatic ring-hydroxylating dioxygenase subunit alpha [Sphingopyxis yananensis]